MSSLNIKELGYGSFAGLVGYSLCHPFDTIKVRKQQQPGYSLVADLKSNGFRSLFRGITSPLFNVVLEKSTLFVAYDWLKHNTENSAWQNGLGAGLLTTLTVTPCERVKIRSQLQHLPVYHSFKQIIRQDGFASLYRGWSATLTREVPGYGLYFLTYEEVKKRKPVLNTWESFGTGALCGMVAWIVIYPSDVVKTQMQEHNMGLRKATSKLWRAGGIGSFYKGLRWGLSRAVVLHGGVFLGYENIKKIAA